MVLATISFFALALFGLGALSVATDTDIIAVPGLGQAPGAIGMAVAVAVFALTLWSTLRRDRPSFGATITIALLTALAHLVVVWIVVLLGSGFVIATSVVGDLVRGGASVVLVVAGLVASWGGIALRRTRAQHPRWPWERDEDE
ncbi:MULTISPECIES: hypothetical protein [unclassified Microbacterium]|uniref:hypothetical protein n=1 Tax=unclassified Microbacterium TaxID=2609290 RepID=UPI0016051B0B|nr:MULTISPECIES: hypothetical protein [unclassified Microbacterium]QNA93430.1 hypothetical protein G4G29_15930 [Microbacterium sp. Se63.02b]QYM63659.1 hypothetical protein K1X59_15975 [Microbacterium sp. Se5.02b]